MPEHCAFARAPWGATMWKELELELWLGIQVIAGIDRFTGAESPGCFDYSAAGSGSGAGSASGASGRAGFSELR